MTKEEQQLFFDKIKESILPLAVRLKDDQIQNIIEAVEKSNENLPKGFGSMLFEQIIIHKYNRTIK